jgi:hypothetical protein
MTTLPISSAPRRAPAPASASSALAARIDRASSRRARLYWLAIARGARPARGDILHAAVREPSPDFASLTQYVLSDRRDDWRPALRAAAREHIARCRAQIREQIRTWSRDARRALRTWSRAPHAAPPPVAQCTLALPVATRHRSTVAQHLCLSAPRRAGWGQRPRDGQLWSCHAPLVEIIDQVNRRLRRAQSRVRHYLARAARAAYNSDAHTGRALDPRIIPYIRQTDLRRAAIRAAGGMARLAHLFGPIEVARGTDPNGRPYRLLDLPPFPRVRWLEMLHPGTGETCLESVPRTCATVDAALTFRWGGAPPRALVLT